MKYYIVAILTLVLVGTLGYSHRVDPIELVNANVFMAKNSDSKEGHATVFAIEDGYLVTANHVCELFRTKEYIMVVGLGLKKILAINIQNDICLLEGDVKATGLKLNLGYKAFQPVFTINYQGQYKPKAIHYGNISEKKPLKDVAFQIITQVQSQQCIAYGWMVYLDGSGMLCLSDYEGVMTTVFGEPGASGGPMLNDNGEVVGLNRAIVQRSGELIFMEAVKIAKLVYEYEQSNKKK